MQRFSFVITLLLASIFALDGWAAKSANSWLEEADKVRNPADNYKMVIAVKSDDWESEFQVFLKGAQKTLIVTKKPASDKGRNMLMLDRDFYAYVPNLKRSMRLSLAQKLSGQVANGDIARTRWFGDYDATIEKQDKKEVQLLLNANKNNLTYQKIRLWVDAKNSFPRRAEYLSVDAKTVLKYAWSENYKTLAGAMRPGLIRIEDKNQQKSTIEVLSMEIASSDDSFFTERNMESMR